MASLMQTAEAWLSIGGRIMIYPNNSLDGALSADHLFSLKLSDEEAERRMTIARAYNAAQAEDPAGLATLVREYGEPTANAFIVWEA